MPLPPAPSGNDGLDPPNVLKPTSERARLEVAAADRLPAWPLISLGLIRGLALAAGGIAIYLTWVSLAASGEPLGCGAGSGCASVLASSWSKVAGIPVSLLALVVYLAVIVASFGVNAASWPIAVASRQIMVLLGAICLAAAVWFVGLQAFVLAAWCPWCLADHALGTALAAIIAVVAVRTRRSMSPRVSRPAVGRPIAVGLAMFAALALVQSIAPSRGPGLAQLAEGKNGDTGPGPQRVISVLGGKLELAVHDQPCLGSPDAPHLIVAFFDYCCPHCRATHGYLEAIRAKDPAQLAILVLPVPLDAKCNSTIAETEPRFQDACALARLALAVHQADRSQFATFDQWLFAHETPRELAAAEAEAARLVGADRLQTALADPSLNARIARHVEAYKASGADRIPLLMSPEFATLVGKPEDETELAAVLAKHWQAAATSPLP